VIVDQVIERSRPERVLHVADPRVLGSEVLLRALRRVREGARLTPYAEWRERVRASCGQAPLYPLLHLFPRDAPPRLTQPRVRCDMQQDERPIVDALGDGAPAWLDRFVETLAG
jgi:hypothetical protein